MYTARLIEKTFKPKYKIYCSTHHAEETTVMAETCLRVLRNRRGIGNLRIGKTGPSIKPLKNNRRHCLVISLERGVVRALPRPSCC